MCLHVSLLMLGPDMAAASKQRPSGVRPWPPGPVGQCPSRGHFIKRLNQLVMNDVS